MNSNNQNMQSSGMVNTTLNQTNMKNSSVSSNISEQNSYKNGFDGDIQKAKEYNKQMSTSGQGTMTSSSSVSNNMK